MTGKLRVHALFGIVAAIACVASACSQDLTVQSGDKEVGKTCAAQSDCPYYLSCDLGACRQRCSEKLACSSGEACSSRGTCSAGGSEDPGAGARVETVRDDLPADVVDLVVLSDGLLYTAGDMVGLATDEVSPTAAAFATGIRSHPYIIGNSFYFARSNGAGFELVVADTSLGTPPFTPTVVMGMSQGFVAPYIAGGKLWLVFLNAAGELTFYDAETNASFTPVGTDAWFSILGTQGVHVASTPNDNGISAIRTIQFSPNPTTVVPRQLRIAPPPELPNAYAINGNDEALPLVDFFSLAPSSTTAGTVEARRYTVNFDEVNAEAGPQEISTAPAPTFADRFQVTFVDTGRSWIYSSNGAIQRLPYPKANAKPVELAKTSTIGSAQPVTVAEYEGYAYWVEPNDGKSTIKRVKY